MVLRRPGQSRRAVAGNPAPGAFAARSTAPWCWATTTCRCWRSPSAAEADQRKVNADLQRVLFADDRDDAARLAAPAEAAARRSQPRLDDGACRPGAEVDDSSWPRRARARSRSSCTATTTASCCKNMYGDKPGLVAQAERPRPRPRDHQHLHPHALLHARAAASPSRTRAAPARQKPGLYPWFAVPGRAAARPEGGLRALVARWACSSARACTPSIPARSGAASSPRCNWTPNCACTRCRAATCPHRAPRRRLSHGPV